MPPYPGDMENYLYTRFSIETNIVSITRLNGSTNNNNKNIYIKKEIPECEQWLLDRFQEAWQCHGASVLSESLSCSSATLSSESSISEVFYCLFIIQFSKIYIYINNLGNQSEKKNT